MTTEIPSYRLSPQQARSWLIDETSVARCVVDVDGPLDVAALRAAVDVLVARHEILRTTYVRRAGLRAPLQAVRDELAPQWHEETSAGAGIDPGAAPFAVTIHHHGADRHAIVLELPGASADAVSLVELVHQLATELTGQPFDLEPLQYADFAEWQRQLAEDEDAGVAAQFWSGMVPAPDGARFAFQRVRPAGGGAGTSAVQVAVPLDDAALGAVAAAAARYGVTSEVFLLGAWHAVLLRHGRGGPSTVAAIAPGRHHEELDGAVGLFSRALPTVVTSDEAMTFADVLDALRGQLAEMLRWQDFVPLEDDVRPLPVAASWISGADGIAAGPVAFHVREVTGGEDEASVRLVARGDDERTRADAVAIGHDPAILDADQAARLAESYAILVRSVAADPQQPLAALPLVSDADRSLVLEAFNATVVPGLGDVPVHERIRARAVETPGAPAVVAAGRTLTYGELDGRANQLAHALLARGVGRDVPVGLCAERSVDALVGLLGILKAGGAYVPLQTDHPSGRLVAQLAEAAAPVVVADAVGAASVAETGVPVVRCDEPIDGPTTDPAAGARPDDLAYVIYTSGSTGVPKGVAVTHANLANYTGAITAVLGLGAGGGTGAGWNIASVSSLSTDLGNTAVYPALTTGACLHLVATDVVMDPLRYRQYAEEHPIDVLKVTPSHLRALLASEGDAVLPRRHLVVGGEASSWDLVDAVLASGRCAMTNHYGPTETTVGSCTFALTGDAPARARDAGAVTVPIGRPIANTRTYVLDEAGRPVPPGVPGELCIAGAGVARGYLHQREQTAERFVADPFTSGATMYRTGDLARFLPDGDLEFLGRADGQVKIRGFRVELAEIEAALARHPSLRQVAVAALVDETGDVRLAAYLVGVPPLPGRDELRAFLAQQLPEHMIPARYVRLDALPMTPSGKIDRRALPEPGDDDGPARVHVAPETPTQETMAGIWADVLGVARVGITDNFFELGGHSLLATQVIARVRSTFSVQLPLHALFTSPTVSGLAGVVDELVAASLSDLDPDMASLLAELEGLSDEEAAALLADDVAGPE